MSEQTSGFPSLTTQGVGSNSLFLANSYNDEETLIAGEQI